MGLQLSPQWVRFAAFVILLVAFIYILFITAPLVWSVLQLFIFVALLSIALYPAVRWLESHRVPRWAAVLEVFSLLFILIFVLFWFLLPPLIIQFQEFITELPTLWNQVTGYLTGLQERYPFLGGALNPEAIFAQLAASFGAFASVVRTVFETAIGGVAAIIIIIIATLFTLLNPWPLVYGLRGLFPSDWWGKVEQIARDIAFRVRGWVVGTLIVSVIVGTMDYIALLLINILYEPDIPFILLFAVLGGILEVIPIIGPIIAAVLPTIVGLAIDPILGLIVLAAFTAIQQIENNLIVPYVMGQAVNMHPVSLLFALVVFGGLFGLIGAILAVPFAIVIKVLYLDWYYPLVHSGHRPVEPPTEDEEMREARRERHQREREDEQEDNGENPQAT